MTRKLTARQKAEIAKKQLKTRVLVTIFLDDGPLRLLENDTLKVLSIGGNDYIATMVKRGDIRNSMDGTVEKVNISISNILQEVSSLVANEGDTLTNRRVKIEEVIFDGDTAVILDDPILLFEGLMNNIQLSAIEFNFDVERVLGGYSTQSPNSTYDVNCQWKFKDERCQYSGSSAKCDKTFTSCLVKTRFGGYPSIPKEMVISAK